MRGIFAILCLSLFGFALEFSNSNVMAASDFPVGTKLEGFTMKDAAGKSQDYKNLKGNKGTVIVFLSAQCPVVKMYNERLDSMAAEYKSQGINFVGVYSNSTESKEQVKQHSSANYKFPVVIDEKNVFADQVGANSTPEVYYFADDDYLKYHGAIDNDRTGKNVTKPYLRVALDDSLAGKAISETNTRAFGCSIKRNETEK